MASKHCLAKLLATLILVFLVVDDTTPAASKLIPDGREKMLAVPSVGIGGRVGGRKMNARRVKMESVRGKFPVAGLSIRRSLRPFPPPRPSRQKSITTSQTSSSSSSSASSSSSSASSSSL